MPSDKGQIDYAAHDEGRYDRKGWGLGQFSTPPSEYMPEKPEPPREGKRKKVKS